MQSVLIRNAAKSSRFLKNPNMYLTSVSYKTVSYKNRMRVADIIGVSLTR